MSDGSSDTIRPQASAVWAQYLAALGVPPSQRLFEKLVGGGRDRSRVEYKCLAQQHLALAPEGEQGQPRAGAACGAPGTAQACQCAALEAEMQTLRRELEALRSAVLALQDTDKGWRSLVAKWTNH